MMEIGGCRSVVTVLYTRGMFTQNTSNTNGTGQSHDSAPSHFSNRTGNQLNITFGARWIGSG
ncbi:hypothetical protein C0J52_24209 [Blattella germanica]|nr:hypothetical protein C0J52_24209 [Blattella germanica]